MEHSATKRTSTRKNKNIFIFQRLEQRTGEDSGTDGTTIRNHDDNYSLKRSTDCFVGFI